MKRAGMTLVEVVAAIALMGVLVTSVVPMLIGAARVVREPRPSVDLAEIARAADFLGEGWGHLGLVVEGTAAPWTWRDGEREIGLAVSLRAVEDAGLPSTQLAALVVEREGVAVTRFVALPEEESQ
ncbi:MAG TPA: type II secretion system protein [Planctomycetota bacterium]|nr:type II secretion system protein [Planctomycetota bacterium]